MKIIEIIGCVPCPKHDCFVHVREVCEGCKYFSEITDYDYGITMNVACRFGEDGDD